MTPERGLKLTGALAAAAELALAAMLAGTRLAAYFAVTAVLTIAVTQAAARFMTPPDPPPEDPGGGPDPEPPWWPEFERDLQRYMHAREPV